MNKESNTDGNYPLRPEPDYFREWKPCECGHYSFEHKLTVLRIIGFNHGACEECFCPRYRKIKYLDWMNQILVGASRACFGESSQHHLCQNNECTCKCGQHRRNQK